MEVAIVALRIVLAAVLFVHAMQKTLGWFQGAGLAAMVPVFERLGQVPARSMILVAATFESLAAVGLLAGFLTPLAGAIGAGTMIVAGASQSLLSRSAWNAQGGGEYPFVLAALGLVIATSGGGKLSVDHALDMWWSDPSTGAAAVLGAGALLVALVAALPPVVRTRRVLAARTTP